MHCSDAQNISFAFRFACNCANALSDCISVVQHYIVACERSCMRQPSIPKATYPVRDGKNCLYVYSGKHTNPFMHPINDVESVYTQKEVFLLFSAKLMEGISYFVL